MLEALDVPRSDVITGRRDLHVSPVSRLGKSSSRDAVLQLKDYFETYVNCGKKLVMFDGMIALHGGLCCTVLNSYAIIASF